MQRILLNLKAFGDFVIAINSVRKIQKSPDLISPPKIIAGLHLKDLANALEIKNVAFIGDDGDIDVPAIFDLRKKGFFEGFKSLIKIINHTKSIPKNSELIFDKLGIRERVIGGGRLITCCPKADNIYLAYEILFKKFGYSLLNDKIEARFKFRRALIIPSSRISRKIIPKKTISDIVKVLNTHGISGTVMSFNGDLVSLPTENNIIFLDRNFYDLVDLVKKYDLVVAADSLPSHLCEFLKIPTFVYTYTPNLYYLPKSAFLLNGWAIFGDMIPFNLWLKKHGIIV